MSETPFTHVHAAVWVAIPGAIFIFLLDDHHDVEEALHGVEWDTLIFFAALFVMVEGLAEMGLLRLIGGALATAIERLDPETRQMYAIILVRWHFLYTQSSYYTQLLAPQLPQLQLWLTWFPRPLHLTLNPMPLSSMSLLQICYVSAVTSAFVDNIPFTTTMIPVIVRLPFLVPCPRPTTCTFS